MVSGEYDGYDGVGGVDVELKCRGKREIDIELDQSHKAEFLGTERKIAVLRTLPLKFIQSSTNTA